MKTKSSRGLFLLTLLGILNSPFITASVQASPLVQNGGFETGSFPPWTLSGNIADFGVTSSSSYVHSGIYGAFAGPSGSLGFLSQTLATVPGQTYVLSFWLNNQGGGGPNEFSVSWNGSTLSDQTSLPAFDWTNYVFAVTATNTSMVLQFGFRNDPSFFALDDVSVTPICTGLTFDAFANFAVVTNGYGGLNWTNFNAINAVTVVTPSGYPIDMVSSNNVAFNNNQSSPATIASANPFNLFSAYLSAAWNDNLQFEAKGYTNGVLVYDNTYILSPTNRTLINFNYLGVTEVDFIASGGTLHSGYSGNGTFFAMDNVNVATGPGVLYGPQITVPLPGSLLGQSAYVRSTIGEPWVEDGATPDNDTAMNSVFGTNGWQDLHYETVNPTALFSPATHFIFLEGSDENANALNTFLTANLTAMQSWVTNGGSLFINAAPNEGGNINFGFGVTLNYGPFFSSSGTAVAPINPIFNGPFTPVGTYWTGNSFSHATVSGAGLIPLIINTNNGSIILGEKAAGSGHVLFGGMTIPFYQSPSPQAANLRANILAYGNANPQGTFDDLAETTSGLSVPIGYRGFNWGNFYCLDGNNYTGNPSGYGAGVVSTNNDVYNGFGSPANITSTNGGHFNFISAELTAAWFDNLQLEAQGYVDGVLTYDQTYTLSATTPTLIVFDYLGVTEVNLIPSGGTPHAGYTGGGSFFAMDNVTIENVIPPVIHPITPFPGGVAVTWNTFVNVPYQLQYKTNLTQASWVNLGSPMTASGGSLTLSNSVGTDPIRFYRVGLQP
jgi:hypothetical protein